MNHHINNGACLECQEIMEKYPGLHPELMTWFIALQTESPEAHVSSAGRGRLDQEIYFQRGASRAHYGQSAHNYNAALDLFQLYEGKAVWDVKWFRLVVAPWIYPALKWYGAPDAEFYELPHVEISNWRDLVKDGKTHLVE